VALDHPVLLAQPVDRLTVLRASRSEDGEHRILARVVHAVGVVAQVGDHVQHEAVVGCRAGRQRIDFLLQQAEQAQEVHVLLVPFADRVSHGPVLSIAGKPQHRLLPGTRV
jgi:hypothetical protein